MSIETLGEAYRLSWRVRVRCVRGYIESPVRVQPCENQAVLDMQTLVWAKGRNFPIGRLGSRLMCPRLRESGRERDLRAAADGADRRERTIVEE
jgi:hypothetical protein